MTEKKERDEYLKAFGAKIKGLSEKRGLGRSEFAAEIGIDRVHLIRIEEGKTNTTVDVIRRIANVLEVKPGKLFPEQSSGSRISFSQNMRGHTSNGDFQGQPACNNSWEANLFFTASRNKKPSGKLPYPRLPAGQKQIVALPEVRDKGCATLEGAGWPLLLTLSQIFLFRMDWLYAMCGYSHENGTDPNEIFP
jgi:transcriptional regulator with XRE-family HTH domain